MKCSTCGTAFPPEVLNTPTSAAFSENLARRDPGRRGVDARRRRPGNSRGPGRRGRRAAQEPAPRTTTRRGSRTTSTRSTRRRLARLPRAAGAGPRPAGQGDVHRTGRADRPRRRPAHRPRDAGARVARAPRSASAPRTSAASSCRRRPARSRRPATARPTSSAATDPPEPVELTRFARVHGHRPSHRALPEAFVDQYPQAGHIDDKVAVQRAMPPTA